MFGVMDVNELGMLCHECGDRFAAVGMHAARAHGLTVAQYRARHGIPRRVSLIMARRDDGLPRRKIEPCRSCGDPKPCASCAEKRRQKPTEQRWRDLTDEEIETLRAAPKMRRPELISRLQHDRVTSKRIAEVLGVSVNTMVRLYPRADWAHSRRGDAAEPGWSG